MQQDNIQQDNIEAAFTGILENVAKLNRADVTGDKRLREDLGIDSLSLIDVAVATEDTFGIRIPDEDLERFQEVGDVLDYIRQWFARCASPPPPFQDQVVRNVFPSNSRDAITAVSRPNDRIAHQRTGTSVGG